MRKHSSQQDIPRRFNPHPTRRLGAISTLPCRLILQTQFQSSPNPKVGCHQNKFAKLAYFAMFQSSPNPKVGCHKLETPDQERDKQVSILTQPEGWVPYRREHQLVARERSFNPHPTRRLGAIEEIKKLVREALEVSILTQPEGWVPYTMLFSKSPHF